ncbi:hypothetical protein FRC07_004879 [Ceratobasidium sp. 392]|nr:hypothetical protein FRC07_004879 [Ceratobasidium sp. 392]
MRFATLALLTLVGFTAAQTPIPPTLTAPTGSVTVPDTASSTSRRTRTSSGTRSGTATGTLSGTLTASANGTSTATASSVTPTTTTYPSLGDASPCVVNCLQVSVAQANCSTIIDVNCYCPSTQFRNTMVQCVASNCPEELNNSEQLGQQFCNIVSVSLTYPPAPTSTTPASTVGPTKTSSPNAATDTKREHGALWAVAAALFGIAAI